MTAPARHVTKRRTTWYQLVIFDKYLHPDTKFFIIYIYIYIYIYTMYIKYNSLHTTVTAPARHKYKPYYKFKIIINVFQGANI